MKGKHLRNTLKIYEFRRVPRRRLWVSLNSSRNPRPVSTPHPLFGISIKNQTWPPCSQPKHKNWPSSGPPPTRPPRAAAAVVLTNQASSLREPHLTNKNGVVMCAPSPQSPKPKGPLHLLKSPGKNENMSSSDRFRLKPKKWKTQNILNQMEDPRFLPGFSSMAFFFASASAFRFAAASAFRFSSSLGRPRALGRGGCWASGTRGGTSSSVCLSPLERNINIASSARFPLKPTKKVSQWRSRVLKKAMAGNHQK